MEWKEDEPVEKEKTTRRELTKAALYAIPAILSMSATPAFASRGSGDGGRRGSGRHHGGGHHGGRRGSGR